MNLSEKNRNASFDQIDHEYINKSHRMVIDMIRKFGNQTTDELEAKLPYKKSGIVARVHELRKRMLITEKGTRKAMSGSKTVQRTLYGFFDDPQVRRDAIDQEWTKCIDERNQIVTALNDLKDRESKAYKMLHKEYEKLTDRCNLLSKMK